ncbi:MAG TPA: hypothetical protein VEW94_09280 [Chloroflexia bacterium]|nr:hypothetical protein [Chloroflexia bacterium]
MLEIKSVDDTTAVVDTKKTFRIPQVLGLRPIQAFRTWQEPAFVTLFFTLLTLAMTWPWALHMGEAINPFGDVVVQMTSLRWNAHALSTNPLGLFEAPFFYPYAHSLAFSENLLGQTLLALPILWLTDNAALAGNFNILLSFVLTGVFTYLLVRDLTGSRAAGIFAGIAFAFCPFRFMQMGHLHMLATQWFPFTLWALHRGLGARSEERGASIEGSGIRGQESDGSIQAPSILAPRPSPLAPRPSNLEPRWLFWAAFGFVAMGLSSVYYIYFLALAVVLYVVWWLVVEAWRLRLSRAEWGSLGLKLGLAALVAGVALAPVYFPYLQSNRELGFSRSTYEVENWAAQWGFYGKVLQSNWLYGKILAPGMTSALGERELFLGIVPLIMAGIGVVWGRSRERFFYLLLGLLALALTFGLSGRIPFTSIEIPLPYAFLYDWVPGFKALRVPVRFALLVDFAVYVLAGYGLARVLGVRGEVRGARGEESGVRGMSVTGGRSGVRNGSLRIGNFGLRPAIAAVIICLMLLEFINPLDTRNRQDVVTQLADSELHGWLAQPENSGPVLDLPMSADQDDVWYTYFATRHWQPLVNGWSSFVPPGTIHLKRALDRFPDPLTVTLLQGLEVRHVVVRIWQYPQDVQADLKRRLDDAPQLEMLKQVGEEYVYRVAPDPWLRRVAQDVGGGTLWVGQARYEAMPTLEVLAYTLRRWGVKQERMGGNISIGYNAPDSLPFGTPADYALVPNMEGAGGVPFGYEGMQEVMSNPAVRLLKRKPELIRSYDFSLPDTPQVDLKDLQMQVGQSDVTFGGTVQGSGDTLRVLEFSFVAFSPTDISVRVGENTQSLRLPAGVSHYIANAFRAPQQVTISRQSGDARLLRVDLLSVENGAETGKLTTHAELMPLMLVSSVDGDMLSTRLSVVPPRQEGQFTITLDVYAEPWGTHPDGHFGSWSMVLPDDGTAHSYHFQLNPTTKAFTATRDDSPIEVFGWEGPPTQGDFRGTLTILDSKGQVAHTSIYTFTRQGDRITGQQAEPATFTIARPGGK